MLNNRIVFIFYNFGIFVAAKKLYRRQSPELLVYVDGIQIREFSFAQKNYKRVLPYGSEKVPVVKAYYKTAEKTEN